jgi:hypothetical protein
VVVILSPLSLRSSLTADCGVLVVVIVFV